MRWRISGDRYLGILLGMILVAGMLGGGCGKEPVPKEPVKQHLNYLLPAVPSSPDPGNLRNEADFQLITSLFEGLVRLNPDGTLEKALAEDWQITDEGKKYVFTIREAHWSNGEKVTAFDFAAALKRNLDPQYNSPYAYLLYDIKNAEGYHRSLDNNYSGKKFGQEKVGIRAENEQTLVIELQKKEPAFLQKLVHPVFYPLPPQAFLASNNAFFSVSGLVGNGPFQLGREEAGERYELVKNKQYWGAEQIKLESMNWVLPGKVEDTWKMFQEKRLDLTSAIPFSFVRQGLQKGQLKSSPLLACYFYQFNVTQKPLHDQRVRQALSYSLNREELIKKHLQGGQKPVWGIIPEGISDSAPGTDFRQKGGKIVSDGDCKKARQLLAEAGYPEGVDFPELELLISENEGHRYFAEKIREEWQKQLGITVNVSPLPWPELLKRMSERKYDLALLGWSADYADPSVYLKSYITGSGNNDSGWVNSAYDEFMKEALSQEQEELRLKAFHQAEDLLMEELPVLPLYQYTKVYAAREGLKGIAVSPLGTGFDFKGTYVE